MYYVIIRLADILSLKVKDFVKGTDQAARAGGAGSEAWNRVYMIAPVKKFGRVGLCTNFIPNKHGGGEEGELAELAFIWSTRVCVGSALFPLSQV